MELHDAVIALLEDKVKATHLQDKIGVYMIHTMALC